MLKKSFLICALASSMFIGGISSAMAEMSEQELRLTALEEKQQANDQLLEILKRFTWHGDLRTRYQWEATQGSAAGAHKLDRDRMRLRFMIGATVHMSKNLDIGFRLDTPGVGTIDSGNATLDGGFGSKGIDLGRAYFNYRPNIMGLETSVWGGKFAPNFMRSEIVWDSDVNPEGFAESFSKKLGDTKVEANFGQFLLDENNPGKEIWLMGYQGVLSQKTGIGKFKFAVAYYDVVNSEGTTSAPTGSSGILNTASEVEMLDIMAEWSEKIMGQKLKIFGEYEQNVGKLAAGVSDLDTAWQIGAKYGKSGEKFGDYDLKVIYRVVQSSAVLDSISDSDFHGGNSNGRGFEAGGSIGLRKGVKLALTYFDTRDERAIGDSPQENQTFQADLKFKF